MGGYVVVKWLYVVVRVGSSWEIFGFSDICCLGLGCGLWEKVKSLLMYELVWICILVECVLCVEWMLDCFVGI